VSAVRSKSHGPNLSHSQEPARWEMRQSGPAAPLRASAIGCHPMALPCHRKSIRRPWTSHAAKVASTGSRVATCGEPEAAPTAAWESITTSTELKDTPMDIATRDAARAAHASRSVEEPSRTCCGSTPATYIRLDPIQRMQPQPVPPASTITRSCGSVG
jgi:hypothetical protein